MTQPKFSPFTLPFYWKSPFRNDGSSLPYSASIGAGPVIQGAVLTAVTTGLIGGETVTYQWTRNGTNIAGATVQIRAVSSAGAGNASDTKFAA
jgi:hypothetical protein